MEEKKRGRKPINDVNRRDIYKAARLTYHEEEKLRHAAKKYGCSESDILRVGIYIIDSQKLKMNENKVCELIEECKAGK